MGDRLTSAPSRSGATSRNERNKKLSQTQRVIPKTSYKSSRLDKIISTPQN